MSTRRYSCVACSLQKFADRVARICFSKGHEHSDEWTCHQIGERRSLSWLRQSDQSCEAMMKSVLPCYRKFCLHAHLSQRWMAKKRKIKKTLILPKIRDLNPCQAHVFSQKPMDWWWLVGLIGPVCIPGVAICTSWCLEKIRGVLGFVGIRGSHLRLGRRASTTSHVIRIGACLKA